MRFFSTGHGVIALVVLTTFSFPEAGEAQSVSNRVRLSADLTLVGFTRTEVDYDHSFRDDYTLKETRFTLLSQGLGLSFAGSLGHAFALGMRVFLGRDGVKLEDEDGSSYDTTQLLWSFEPFVEFMLKDGPAVPFILAGLTLDGVSQEDDDGDEYKEMYLGFRVGLGAHFFAGDSFSIDPRFEIGWANEIADDDEDLGSQTRLRLGLFIGFTGWFGESELPTEPQPPYGQPAPTGPAYVGRAPQPTTVSGPTPANPDPSTVAALELASGVTATLSGTPGRDPVSIRFRRRGARSVLASCRELRWAIDGDPMSTPVGHSQARNAAGVLETLDGAITIEDTARLARAGEVALTVCGATFQLTAVHRQQLDDFTRRMRPSEREPLENPWAPPADDDSWAPPPAEEDGDPGAASEPDAGSEATPSSDADSWAPPPS